MQLHQVLRMIKNETPITLVDLNDRIIFEGLKDKISVDLYEYDVLYFTAGVIHGIDKSWSCIKITLQK